MLTFKISLTPVLLRRDRRQYRRGTFSYPPLRPSRNLASTIL